MPPPTNFLTTFRSIGHSRSFPQNLSIYLNIRVLLAFDSSSTSLWNIVERESIFCSKYHQHLGVGRWMLCDRKKEVDVDDLIMLMLPNKTKNHGVAGRDVNLSLKFIYEKIGIVIGIQDESSLSRHKRIGRRTPQEDSPIS
ncbi:hypothetical protein DMENIID0001_071930 [Sergentomyia squamirostris]